MPQTSGCKSPEVAVLSAILETAHAINRAMDLESLEQGLTPEQISVLKVLHEGKDNVLLVAHIAHRLGRQPHSTGCLLDRMQAAGLVAKQRGAKGSQANWVTVSLTRKGEEVYRSTADERAVLQALSSSVPAGDCDRMMAALNSIKAAAVKQGYILKYERALRLREEEI